MKRISWFLIAIFIFAGTALKVQAQDISGGNSSAINYSGLENKLKKSESEIQDAKKSAKIKTWTSRASLLIDIYNVTNDLLRKGMEPVTVKLLMKDPKEIRTADEDGNKVETYVYDRAELKFINGKLDSWVDTKPITDNPLDKAIEAVNEAQKLNTDGKSDRDISDIVKRLKAALENQAISEYSAKKFHASHDDFEKILTINKLPEMQNVVDTVYIYYAGRAALEDKDYTEANKLFEEASSYKYNDPMLYVFRKQSYFASGDTAKGVDAINEGFEKYPNNQSLMIELINYYLVSNKADKALSLLAKAKENDPKNASYTFAEGTLYDKMHNFDKAEEAYKQCLEIDPNFLNATYNLGVLYFNQAVKIYEEASKISDNTEYEKKTEDGNAMLMKAVPYMEKASETTGTDSDSQSTKKSALETLKTIFYRLKMEDKYQDVVNRLKSM